MSYIFERRAARVPLPEHGFPNKSIRKTGLFWAVLFSEVDMFMYGGSSCSMLYGTMLQMDRAAKRKGKVESEVKVESGAMNRG